MVQSQNWYLSLFVTIPLFLFSIVSTQGKMPGRSGIRYGFRKAKKSIRQYTREKQMSTGRKSWGAQVGSARLVKKTGIHSETGLRNTGN